MTFNRGMMWANKSNLFERVHIMKIATPMVKTLILAGVAIVLISACVAVFISEADADSRLEYEMNDSGMTYGSSLYATYPEDEPDLIEAIATNGEVGYVKKAELDEATSPASNPDEAVAMMNERLSTQQDAFCNALANKGLLIDRVETDAAFTKIIDNPDIESSMIEQAAQDLGTSVDDIKYAYTKAREATSVSIDVYTVDGKNVIGKYVIS